VNHINRAVAWLRAGRPL